MTSISTASTFGSFFSWSIACLPFSAKRTIMPWSSSMLVSEKMLRTSSSTTRMLFRHYGIGVVQVLEHLPFLLGELRFDPVEEERGLIEQTLRRLHVLHDDRLRVLLD